MNFILNLTNYAKLNNINIISFALFVAQKKVFFDSQDRLKSQKRMTDLRQRLFTCRDYCVNGLHIQSTDIKFNSSLLKLEKASLFRLIYMEKLRCM